MDGDSLNKRLQEVLAAVSTDIASIRTGRVTPALVEDIVVDAYGGQAKLKVQELATISIVDTQTLTISPFDKSIIGDIKKGIMAANVGLNPSIDSDIIRISMPPMTTEDREKYVKILGGKIESGKVMVRQIRADVMKDIKEAFDNKELSEDEKFAKEKELQAVIDEYTGKVDDLGDRKKKELLQI